MYIDLFTSFSTIRAIVIYSFLLIILLTFIKFLFVKDNDEKSMQKVIGGISVFVVAIISQNEWVFSLSLFIGGLIIASEKFMRALAAIMRASGDKLPDTISALDNVDVSKASPKDVKQQREEEIKEVTAVSKEDRFKSIRQRVEHQRKIENLIIAYYAKEYGHQFEPRVKLENEYGVLILDGAVRSMRDGNILTFLKVQYTSDPEDMSIEFLVRRTLERIRYLMLTTPVVVAIVSEKITPQFAKKYQEEIKERYKNVTLEFFKNNGEDSVEKII